MLDILLISAVLIVVAALYLNWQQVRIVRKTVLVPTLIEVLREYRSKEMRVAREFVQYQLRIKYPEVCALNDLPDNADRERALHLSHFYDNLGLLVLSERELEKPVLLYLGRSAISSWVVLKDY
jgi:hypothetical protein